MFRTRVNDDQLLCRKNLGHVSAENLPVSQTTIRVPSVDQAISVASVGALHKLKSVRTKHATGASISPVADTVADSIADSSLVRTRSITELYRVRER